MFVQVQDLAGSRLESTISTRPSVREAPEHYCYSAIKKRNYQLAGSAQRYINKNIKRALSDSEKIFT